MPVLSTATWMGATSAGEEYSLMVNADRSRRPSFFAPVPANQTVPSGATVIPCRMAFGVGTAKVALCPDEGSYMAILFEPSVIQTRSRLSVVTNHEYSPGKVTFCAFAVTGS